MPGCERVRAAAKPRREVRTRRIYASETARSGTVMIAGQTVTVSSLSPDQQQRQQTHVSVNGVRRGTRWEGHPRTRVGFGEGQAVPYAFFPDTSIW